MAQWVRADIHFAAMFSYRLPDTSPSYALCSPMPSPAAIRLALVDAVIRHTGSVEQGKSMFELVKAAPLKLQPPEKVSIIKFFIKRFKPGKDKRPLQSIGVREYCLPCGPITVWLKTDDPSQIEQAFRRLRRLGTTDSLAWCTTKVGDQPDPSLCMHAIDKLPIEKANFARRVCFTLHELKDDVSFQQVNPYDASERANPYRKQGYMMPLVYERSGGNWVILRREPFNLDTILPSS